MEVTFLIFKRMYKLLNQKVNIKHSQIHNLYQVLNK